MGNMFIVTVIFTFCVLTIKAQTAGFNQFHKEALLHELQYQIRAMEQRLFVSCPNVFKPQVTKTILGRRNSGTLDLDISLAQSSLDDLKQQYVACTNGSSPTPASGGGTTGVNPGPSVSPTSPAGPPDNCGNQRAGHAFTVLKSQNVTYQGYAFLALQVRVPVNGCSASENWCRDYQRLCSGYSRKPTGCGQDFANVSGFKDCKDKYGSDMNISNVLDCNPSVHVANAANKAFSGNSARGRYNAFAFHTCDILSCHRTIKDSFNGLTSMQGFWSDGNHETTMYTLCH